MYIYVCIYIHVYKLRKLVYMSWQKVYITLSDKKRPNVGTKNAQVMRQIIFPSTACGENISIVLHNYIIIMSLIFNDYDLQSMKTLKWLSSLTSVVRERTSEEQPACMQVQYKLNNA